MATPYTKITLNELEELANEYIAECLENTKEQATQSGKIINVKDRHLPTIQYFLRIWIPMKGKPTISRSTYYEWLSGEEKSKSDTIKKIDGLFESLAIDIVANEGKGIFYAKNKLGMTDKTDNKNEHTFKGIDIKKHFGYDSTEPEIQTTS